MRFAASAFALSALSSVFLSACLPQPTDSHWTAREWAPIGEKRPADPPAIWCYQTIGKADCYHEQLPGQDYRLIEGGPVSDPKNMSVAAKPAQVSEPVMEPAPVQESAKAPEPSMLDRLTGLFDL